MAPEPKKTEKFYKKKTTIFKQLEKKTAKNLSFFVFMFAVPKDIAHEKLIKISCN